MAKSRRNFARWRLGWIGIFLISMIGAAYIIHTRSMSKVDAKKAYELAQSHIAERNLIAARDQLKLAMNGDPKWADPSIQMATVAIELLDGNTAIAAIDKARAAGVNPAQIMHLRGHALWLIGDLDGAEAVLNSDEMPNNQRIYAGRILSRVYTDRGNFSAASSVLDRMLSDAPNDSMVWTDLARMRMADGNQKGAIEAVTKAVALDGSNVRALEMRGKLARTQIGFKAALPWFEQALNVNGNDAPVLAEYAATLGDMGRATDMLKQVRKLSSVNRYHPAIHYMQAAIAARASEYALAKRVLERASDATRDLPASIMLAGICEYQLGNHNFAATIFQKLVDRQPMNLRARKMLARAMFRAGNSFGTIDVLRPIADRGDADNYTLHLISRAYEATDQRSKAASYLNRAIVPAVRDTMVLLDPLSFLTTQDEAKRSPDDARRTIPYIRNLMKNGNADAASQLANALQAKNPNVADAHILAGDVAMARGSRELALSNYTRARTISFTEPLLLKIVDANRRLGSEAGARSAIAAFLAENPNSLSALRLSAYVDLDIGKWQDAAPKLEKLRARIGNNDVVLNANLARAYSALGRNDEAIEMAALAYKIDPANPMVTYTYGGVLFKAGTRPKAALDLLEKASILSPNNAEVQKTYAAAKSISAQEKAK
jgi:cellulose synthase operon protein C